MSTTAQKSSKKAKKNSKNDEKEIDNQENLLEIKKELNFVLKDLFEEHNQRLKKLESILLSREEKDPENETKTPEHCYN